MPRPLKAGLDYFPHDTDASGDEKVQALMAIYGSDGYVFYFVMLERIYRTENGVLPCGKLMEKVGISRRMGLTIEVFDKILESSLEVGCFDKEEYERTKCLTSNGIRKRIESVLALRAKERERKENYLNNKKKEKTKRGKPTENPTENSKYIELFDILWSKYPNKDGRKEALRHFNASVVTDDDASNIKKALSNYLASEKVMKGYVKNGSTWFNNWSDWIVAPLLNEKTSEQSDDPRRLAVDKIKMEAERLGREC